MNTRAPHPDPQLYCIVCFDNGKSSRIILLSFTFVVVSLELNAIFKLCLIDIVFFILLRSVIFFIVCERKNNLSVCLFVFGALRPKSTAMVIAGRSVHLTTLFPGQA